VVAAAAGAAGAVVAAVAGAAGAVVGLAAAGGVVGAAAGAAGALVGAGAEAVWQAALTVIAAADRKLNRKMVRRVRRRSVQPAAFGESS
jgi:hypothetical protein